MSIEAGATLGWSSYVGDRGFAFGIDHFGASAPAADMARDFGFTAGERRTSRTRPFRTRRPLGDTVKNPIQQLLDAGQSVWIDNLRRSMFASGELNRLIDRGLRGMTSNPTIFEKAIGAGNDYDEQLSRLIGSEKNADALFWDLAIEDIRNACDAFSGVYQSSGGNDGFVSLEVSPLLANDTPARSRWSKNFGAGSTGRTS